ncbi:SymE family type I addiction module toxin [Trinickia soli]|uniref:SymE family type I addiction module toxin n=1 Tax=Trinickia soli TaxID=380675 RepID=UPI00125223BB|nr:type I toxin-antitoxin system SymE family toxin [Paraburkholderia sp. T12-10]
MADANLKAFDDAHPSRSVTIQQSPRWQPYSPRRRRPAPPLVPWFKLSGRWLEQAGFEPRQRLKIEVQHERLVITPA